jgi:hypothetical protein
MRPAVEFFDFISLLPAVEMATWWRVEHENQWDSHGPRFNHGRRIKVTFAGGRGGCRSRRTRAATCWPSISTRTRPGRGARCCVAQLRVAATAGRRRVVPGVAGRGRGGVAPSAVHPGRVGWHPTPQEVGLTKGPRSHGRQFQLIESRRRGTLLAVNLSPGNGLPDVPSGRTTDAVTVAGATSRSQTWRPG